MTTGTLSSKKTKPFGFINHTVNKKELENLLSKVYIDHGSAKTGVLANALKDLGFRFATKAGVTISIEDLSIPEVKKEMLERAEEQIETAQHRFHKGEITEVERYTKVIDTWAQTTEELTKAVVDGFDRLNPVYMMAFSGARGNVSQVRQLVGMRGLMADSQGQIIDIPIKTNFKEGLSVTEYIISSYGARKGLVDTALKTADSGYLTRRLVDVAQDVIITEEDCGTEQGVRVESLIEGDKVIVSLRDRMIGRCAAGNIASDDGEVLAQAGEIITPEMAEAIIEAGVKFASVRSGITCQTEFGVCRKCYGWSLTNNKLVDVGEAIGIMAAQSIGEPGTQLTMRTFHTGGVFSGTNSNERVLAKHDGTLQTEVPVREIRSRHGDVQQVSTRDLTIEVKTSSGTDKYTIPYNAFMFAYEKGTAVKKGDLLAEYEPVSNRGDSRRLTEKAAKDIKSELAGEVQFDSFDADEKRDRQGNITRTATKSGTIWVLQGDVYNLPSGSKCEVKTGDKVKPGDVLAETMVVSEHGGEVRIPEDLTTEKTKSGKETIEKVTAGKELTIIIASLSPANAELEQTKKEQLWQVSGKKGQSETYIVKSPAGTTVENASVIAELVDDSNHVPSSGEIIYDDIELDENRVLTKPGKIFFVPEEIHQISKDISLKLVESGTFVEAGTEVVKGINCRISGIVEVVEDNDIIQEVVIRPGTLHKVDNVGDLKVEDGTVVDAKTEIAPGIKTKEKSYIGINFLMRDTDDDTDMDDVEDTSAFEYAEVLIRPVQEFEIAPHEVKIDFDATDKDNISIVPVTQLTYKDGDKIRHIEGAPLLRTSLVLQMKGHLSHLKGIVEKTDNDNLKIAVLENLTIRRESAGEGKVQDDTQTQLLVKHGEFIQKRTPVVKTQVLALTEGQISLGSKTEEDPDVRRILIVTEKHTKDVTLKGKPSVKVGEYVRMDDEIASGEKATFSGQVVEASAKGLTLRVGQPYLISVGTQLQVEANALVQRGDLIATLIFERQKSGDIVQGLPRVEELLEGRKSKETAILASYDAKAEIVWDDDVPRLYLVSEDKGRDEVVVPIGTNFLVEDGDKIEKGQQLTDGSINPHDILEILGPNAVRKHLVDEVQRVYRSQGVEIADKHLEIIVRQMTKKVKVDDAGDTRFLPGELVDEKELLKERRRVEAENGNLPTSMPQLLGITKASLNTESFISAASFQETTRVLTEAAVEGKLDILRGLKENVIIGRLIPAGTGFPEFIQAREERIEELAASSKFASRKPSAILEEIESMFGSPEVSDESLGAFVVADDDIILDEEDTAGLTISDGDDAGLDDDE
jgi:DNA-directed RNA polymerase subunit beta'